LDSRDVRKTNATLNTELRTQIMKTRNIENGLALIGAMIVIIGVSFAAESALAKESAPVTATAVAINDVADSTLRGAKQAIDEAASQAARSLASENWIDLDIKFVDHTSSLVAGMNGKACARPPPVVCLPGLLSRPDDLAGRTWNHVGRSLA